MMMTKCQELRATNQPSTVVELLLRNRNSLFITHTSTCVCSYLSSFVFGWMYITVWVRVFATLATWPKKHFPVISPCKHKCTVVHHVAATKNVVVAFKYVSDIVGGVEIGWLPLFCFAKEGAGCYLLWTWTSYTFSSHMYVLFQWLNDVWNICDWLFVGALVALVGIWVWLSLQ